ncbi:MAG: hypothetical protein M3342_21045 [Bacteroidota bacterium]|nr:hypothetical protein [Bacteroidota bacterium]
MVLRADERKEYFSNYLPLLFYAGVYEGILPESSTLADFAETSLEEKVACRDVLFKDPDVLSDFRKDNSRFLKIKGTTFIDDLSKGILSNFIVLQQKKAFAVFMDTQTGMFYHVMGISDPFDELLNYIPCYVETAIFNFNDKLICDGLLKGGNIQIGPNYKRQFSEDYREQLKEKKVINLLP